MGLVSARGFKLGWANKGCFYNGNITNGSAGLIIVFGKRTDEGGIIDVYQQCTSSSSLYDDDRNTTNGNSFHRSCDIKIIHNVWCLGAGFSLDDNDDLDDQNTIFICDHILEEALPWIFDPAIVNCVPEGEDSCS